MPKPKTECKTHLAPLSDCSKCRFFVSDLPNLPSLVACRRDRLFRARALVNIYIGFCPSLLLLVHRSEVILPARCIHFESRTKNYRAPAVRLSQSSFVEFMEAKTE